MLSIVNAFIEICLFRRGPQDLPVSNLLLVLALLANLIAGIFMLQESNPVDSSVFIAVFDMALMIVLLKGVLVMRHHPERFIQTLTALAGSGALLSLVAWPVTRWYYLGRDAGGDSGLPAILILILLFWNVGIIGHILRHALSTSLGAGIGLAVIYVFLSINLTSFLFPSAT